MPNAIKNILKMNAPPERVQEILSQIKLDTDSELLLDFNKLNYFLQKQKDSSASVRDSLDKGNNYSSKYYLSNILFCEDCGSPFRRYTWTARGNKKIVWMCKVRKNKGGREKCPVSPSIEESGLHLF